MRKLFVFSVLLSIFTLSLHIYRDHEACPFACLQYSSAEHHDRYFYYTELPTFGLFSPTLYVSPELRKMMDESSRRLKALEESRI